MKVPTLSSFLEDCRAANTSDEIALVVDQIENKIGTMRADRSKMEGQLQEAIVAGRDPGKIHTVIAQADQDLMTLQAAMAGFSQKQADVRKHEEGNAAQALSSENRLRSQELAAVAKELAATLEKGRALGARMAEIVKQHDRTNDALRAKGQPETGRSSAIVRENIGEVPRANGVTEYGRRLDSFLVEALELNPGHLMRARDSRRQRGRVGESSAFNDAAVEALMTRARGG